MRNVWTRGRRLIFSSLTLCLLLTGICARAEQKLVLKQGAQVAVVGDSITEQKQYSRFIELYLLACNPHLDLRVVQLGWSGETARGFANRMANDLMPFKPDTVTTCYGMNDGGYRPFDDGIGKNYEVPMREIVGKLKVAGVTVVVGSPGAVDTKYWRTPDQSQMYNDSLAHLRDIAKKIADENGFPFANVHDAMIEAMSKGKAALGDDYDVGGRDGVHPGANGHLVMAYAFLKAIGFDGNLGSITVDMKGKAEAAGGHKVLAAQDGVVSLESCRYPFCFSGDEKSSGGTRSILPFVPFNQDLNRLTLIVKNLGSDRATVGWGAASKTFARADLEKGVNLAAEFPENPFSEPFRKVEKLVQEKQALETTMIKNCITHFPAMLRLMEGDDKTAASLQTVRDKLMAKQADLGRAARAAIQPVKHDIRIVSETK